MNIMTIPDNKKRKIQELYSKTEDNIRRIQAVGEIFVYPVLNQWRYAAAHVFKLLDDNCNPQEADLVIDHLRSAYKDSCEILLDFLLDNAHAFLHKYRHMRLLREEAETTSNFGRAFIDGLICRHKIEERDEYAGEEGIRAMEDAIREIDGYDEMLRDLKPRLEAEYVSSTRKKSIHFILALILTVCVSLVLALLWR